MARSHTQAPPVEPDGDPDQLMSYEQLRSLIKIDSADLDGELVNHANLYWHTSAQHDWAQVKAEAAKAHVDEVEASCRLDLTDDETKKRTVAQLSAEVDTDKSVLTARRHAAEAREDMIRWASMRETYRQRGQNLRAMVELYATNYYQTGTDQVRTRGSYSDARYSVGKEAIRRDHSERNADRSTERHRIK